MIKLLIKNIKRVLAVNYVNGSMQFDQICIMLKLKRTKVSLNKYFQQYLDYSNWVIVLERK